MYQDQRALFYSAHLESELFLCVVPTGTVRSGPTCGWGATRTASVWRNTLTESSWRWGSWRARTKERTKFWMNTASLSAPCSSLWKVRGQPDLQVISTALDWVKIKMFWWLTTPSSVNVRWLFKLNWKLRELVERVLSFQILSLCSDPPVPSTLLHLHTCSYIYLPFFFYLIPVCLDPCFSLGRRFCLQGS